MDSVRSERWKSTTEHQIDSSESVNTQHHQCGESVNHVNHHHSTPDSPLPPSSPTMRVLLFLSTLLVVLAAGERNTTSSAPTPHVSKTDVAIIAVVCSACFSLVCIALFKAYLSTADAKAQEEARALLADQGRMPPPPPIGVLYQNKAPSVQTPRLTYSSDARAEAFGGGSPSGYASRTGSLQEGGWVPSSHETAAIVIEGQNGDALSPPTIHDSGTVYSVGTASARGDSSTASLVRSMSAFGTSSGATLGPPSPAAAKSHSPLLTPNPEQDIFATFEGEGGQIFATETQASVTSRPSSPHTPRSSSATSTPRDTARGNAPGPHGIWS